MGLFGGKKKKKAVSPIQPRGFDDVYLPPSSQEKVHTSREYKLFKKTDERKKTWYEVAAGLAASFVAVSPDGNTKKSLEKAIAFTGMRITPGSAMSLFVVSLLFFVMVGIALIVGGALPVIGGVIFMAIGLALSYWLLKYPMSMLKKARIEASSQIVLAVLYMVVSMRISPNLERAFRFAASNVSGILAWDMRRLIWDMEMGKYYSANEALDAYIARWKPENEEFAEALRLIRDSTRQTPERAKGELDEALNVILEGTKTRMKYYAQDLKTPVMVIHMMGIVLPILGTILAPLAAVFMADLVGPIHFIIGYDIVLPIVIIWFINNTLNKRPMTFSPIDISHHPDLPPPGYIRRGKRNIPVLPIALAVAFVLLIVPVLYFAQKPELLATGISQRGDLTEGNNIISMTMSALLILGAGFGIATYLILSNYQRMGIQSRIQSVEGEFEMALYQLGNHISAGTPTEVAIEKSIEDVKDLSISDLFKLTLRNIRNLGMTFESALFDKQYGSLRHYPSELIRNIMYTVVDTAKKGVTYAAESMLRISSYLKNIRETQEYIRDMLSETASSMKFQAYLLTPLITGLIVSMADVIVQVLSGVGRYLENMEIGNAMGLENIGNIFGNMDASISPEVFQLIIGVYLIEILAILAMFINKISVGENKMSMYYEMGKMLIIGIVVYLLVALGSSTMFGGLIRNALGTLLG